MQRAMRCSVCGEEAASVSVGHVPYCLMDYNCSPHILKPPHKPRILDQQLYEHQLQITEELWRSAIADSLAQLIQQQEKMRAKEQENPLAMLDVPTHVDHHAVVRIPKKQSKKPRHAPAAADALNPYQRRPTRPQKLLFANPLQEPSQASSEFTTPVVRGPVCPSCTSDQTRVLFFGTNLEVARNETWGNKDAPSARKRCECENCGHEWVVED